MISTRSPSGTIVRATAALHAILSKGKPSSLNDLTHDLGLPRPTVYRLLTTLVELRLLEKHPATRRYGVGRELISLTEKMNAGLWPSISRHKLMEDLVEALGETCNYVIRIGSGVIWLDRVETTDPIRLHIEAGLKAPLHCTASGKLFLSYLPESEILRVIGSASLQTLTKNTVTDIDTLLKQLVEIRKTRISIEHGEFIAETSAIAVPVDSPDGNIIAALSAHGPSYRFKQKSIEKFIPKLRATARAFLGHSE